MNSRHCFLIVFTAVLFSLAVGCCGVCAGSLDVFCADYPASARCNVRHLHHHRAFHHAGAHLSQSGPNILDTGYALLSVGGTEQDGFGLYSYAIMTNRDPERAKAFVDAVTKSTAPVSALHADKALINVLYVPAHEDGPAKADATPIAYDFDLAHDLLDRICSNTALRADAVCRGDMSQGPYIFTYAHRLGQAAQLAPPYLLADLSSLHAGAFATVVAAFKEQVKSGPLGNDDKLRNLRLSVLNVVLKASDWVSPIRTAVADIVHAEFAGAK